MVLLTEPRFSHVFFAFGRTKATLLPFFAFLRHWLLACLVGDISF